MRGDAALAAKAIATFRREHELLAFKGGTMDGDAVSVDEIEAIAKLPARNVLDGQLVGVLASPVTGLVRGLNQLIAGLALQLGQIAEQGLVSGEAPPAEEPRRGRSRAAATRAIRPPRSRAAATATRRPMRPQRVTRRSPPRKTRNEAPSEGDETRRRASQWQPQPRRSGSKS